MKAKDIAAELNATMKGSLLRMGSDEDFVVKYLPTGIVPIDDLLGGGIPRGRAVEFFGNYSTMKTYVALKAIAQTQAAGHLAALVDTEHAFDPEWAIALGCDVDSLILAHPETGEEAVDAVELLIRRDVDLIVWDSVAASLPKAEAEKSATDKMQPARLAQMMSAALRKLTAANQQTALLFINQTRVNVGVTFGNPEQATGGKALPFYASQRIAMRKAGTLKRDIPGPDGKRDTRKETYGVRIRATLEKSKLNKPHREVLFTYSLDDGAVDEVGYLIDVGVMAGTYMKKNGWYWVPVEDGKPNKMREADFRAWVESEELA